MDLNSEELNNTYFSDAQDEDEDPNLEKSLEYTDNYKHFLEVMGCCHSLNLINEKIIGDPTEMEMFKKTNFSLIFNKNIVDPI